jgi:iron complex outermembrane receptor protein
MVERDTVGREGRDEKDPFATVREFDIKPQEIARALLQYGEQSGLTVMVRDDATGDSPGLQGTYTVAEALDSLLAGTGLEYGRRGDAIIVTRVVAEVTPAAAPSKKPSLIRRVGASLATALFATSAATAAEGGASSTDTPIIIEEIIVVAERREESILEVPLSMTAFDGRKLEELGLTNVFDLEQQVPGLQFGDDNEQKGHGTVIRGIGTFRGGESQVNVDRDLAVSTSIDDVFTFAGYGLAPQLFDLERVEILRGPQGTMRGRNAIAGAINYYTKKPTDEWDAVFQTDFTDQFTQRYNVAFGGPLSENFSFRITAGYYEGDGAQENVGLGGDYDAPDQISYSPQLRFKTDRLDINLRYAYVEDKGAPRTQIRITEPDRVSPCIGAPPDYDGPLTDANGNCIAGSPNPHYLYDQPFPAISSGCPVGVPGYRCGDLENKINVNAPGISDSDRETWILNTSFDVTEMLTVRYNYGQSDVLQTTSRDNDNTNVVAPETGDFVGGTAGIDSRIFTVFPYDESTHELQLVSDFDGAFNFVAGLFYYENENAWSTRVENFALSGVDDLGNPWRRFSMGADAEAAALGTIQPGQVFGFFPFAPVPVSNCDPDFLEGVLNPFLDLINSFSTPIRTVAAIETGCDQRTDHTVSLTQDLAVDTETRAAYFTGDYRVNERWLISGGLRHSEDYKEKGVNRLSRSTYFLGVPVFSILNNFALPPSDGTWRDTIGHLGVEYSPQPNRLIYGRVSTGYRSGGFNYDNAGEVANPGNLIKSETNINYELGIKGLFDDQRLLLTAAVFYYDFDDYQVLASQEIPAELLTPFHPSPVTEWTDNIEGSSIWGAEAEFEYALSERWRFSGFYAYQDSEIGTHSSVVRGDPNAEIAEWEHLRLSDGAMVTTFYTRPTVLSGNQLPMQPKHKAALTVTFSTSLQEFGSLQLGSTLSYVGKRYPSIGNTDFWEMPSYERWDLRGTWTSQDQAWSVTAYVQNALDEIGLVEVVPDAPRTGGAGMATLTEPRQFGLQVRWRPNF